MYYKSLVHNHLKREGTLVNFSIKIMLLGITIILAGVIVQNEPGLRHGFLIGIAGIIVVLIGFLTHDSKTSENNTEDTN